MSHAYWRIANIINNGDGSWIDVNELEFRATVGGADQCSGGTALDNGSHYYVPSQAFDNNLDSLWIGSTGGTQYLGYHFASAVEVTQIAITATYPGEAARAPKDFTLDHSDDGTTWTTVLSITGQTGWGTKETRLFNLVTYILAGNITESLAITDWIAMAINCNNGIVSSSYISSGATYSLVTTTLDTHNIIIVPKVDYAWSTAKVAALNDYVVPSAPDTTSHLWKVTTAGTFAATEATWNLSGTTTQGTAVLTYVAPLVNPVALGPRIPA